MRKKAEELEAVRSEEGTEAQSQSAVEPRNLPGITSTEGGSSGTKTEKQESPMCMHCPWRCKEVASESLLVSARSHRKSKLQPDHTNRNGKNPEPIHLSRIRALQIVF